MLHAVQEKEKPMLNHAIILICLVLIITLFLASGYAWSFAALAAITLLNLADIHLEYVSPQYLLYLKLQDGSVVGFQVLMEYSGLITLLIFSFVSAFTIGLLKGDLKTKLVWFILSMCIGFVWNLSRIIVVIAIAYNFGLPAFSFVHFILTPAVDFVWVVSTWALGMSWLKREAQR
jgi:exosortase/archaeosortase family protein